MSVRDQDDDFFYLSLIICGLLMILVVYLIRENKKYNQACKEQGGIVISGGKGHSRNCIKPDAVIEIK